MTPTVFRKEGFRLFFFSREELRMHVHVYSGSGEAKFWMEPDIELAQNYGIPEKQLARAKYLIEEHAHEIRNAWRKHFGD